MPQSNAVLVLAILILLAQSLRASPQATPEAKTPQTLGRLTPGGEVRIPSKHSGLPAKGDFQAVTQESAEDQEHRQIREAHFATRTSDRRIFPEIKDPGKLVGGQAETTGMMIYDYAGGMSTLPARTSAAVVIGTVVSGKAFLAQDHTYVYSDFAIKIDDILKPDANANLVVGEQLVAYREGGTIRFPSGHVRNFLDKGQGYPTVGAQYLFFLGRPDTNIREYQMTLFATYQLVNGLVFPLDDGMDQYEGKSQTVLLDQVRKLIASSQNGASSPVVIDVSGKGFVLTDAQNGVRFDISGTGDPIQMGWTVAGVGNAFLARPGPDALVHNGRQLFGNFTPQPIQRGIEQFLEVCAQGGAARIAGCSASRTFAHGSRFGELRSTARTSCDRRHVADPTGPGRLLVVSGAE